MLIDVLIRTSPREAEPLLDGAAPLHSESLPSDRTSLKSCGRCWMAVLTCDLLLCTCHCLAFLLLVSRQRVERVISLAAGHLRQLLPNKPQWLSHSERRTALASGTGMIENCHL